MRSLSLFVIEDTLLRSFKKKFHREKHQANINRFNTRRKKERMGGNESEFSIEDLTENLVEEVLKESNYDCKALALGEAWYEAWVRGVLFDVEEALLGQSYQNYVRVIDFLHTISLSSFLFFGMISRKTNKKKLCTRRSPSFRVAQRLLLFCF
jgi:hypothetical protein